MIINIYRINNKTNNKSYIGITKNNPIDRIKKHFNDLLNDIHHSPKLQNSYNIYGSENFGYEIIGAFDVEPNEITNLENKYIEKYNSIENGYNCMTGGYGTGMRSKRSEYARARKNLYDESIIMTIIFFKNNYSDFHLYPYVSELIDKSNYKNVRSMVGNSYMKERNKLELMNFSEILEMISMIVPISDIIEFKKNKKLKDEVSSLKNYIHNKSPYLSKITGLTERVIKSLPLGKLDDNLFINFIIKNKDISYLNIQALNIIYDLEVMTKKEVLEKYQIRRDDWVFKKSSYKNEKIFASIISKEVYATW